MRHQLDARAFLAKQADGSAALCVTDPPWALQGGGRFDDVANYAREPVDAILDTLTDLQRVLVKGGALYMFAPSGYQLEDVFTGMKQRGWRFQRLLVWEKGENGLGAYQNAHEPVLIYTNGEGRGYECGGKYRSLLKFPRPAGRTAKPWQLYKVFIEMSSRAGELVLDPYCGTNPLAAACRQLAPSRRWAASDIASEAEVEAGLATTDSVRAANKRGPLPANVTQRTFHEPPGEL